MKEKDNDLILVVDDCHLTLKVITELLEDCGYGVITCDNADRAMHLLGENNINAVLTDISMPGISGLEFLEKVHSFNIDIPVILMTGYANVDWAVASVKKRAFDFLYKPIVPEQLFHSVKKAVKHNRQLQEEKLSRTRMEEQFFQSAQDWENTFNSLTDMITISDRKRQSHQP